MLVLRSGVLVDRLSRRSAREVERMVSRSYSSWGHRFGLLRARLAGAPLWCSWQVTYRCQLRCRFCNYWRMPSSAAEEMTPEEFGRGAENLGRLGTLFVSLAGGEPLLRHDLEAIVAAVARRHITFFTTNGWDLSADRAAALWQAGLWGASVSIDYADAARHDAARGRPGAFRAAVSALEHLSRTRTAWFQQVNLQAVLLNDNLDDLEGLAELAYAHRANLMVQPYSPAKIGRLDLRPQPPVSARLLDLKRRWPNFHSSRWFLARFDQYLTQGIPRCGAGTRFLNIDHCGIVSRCVEEMDQPVGSVLDAPIETLLDRLRQVARNDGRCRACWYNCRGEVEALYSLRGFIEQLPTYLAGPLRTLWRTRGRTAARV
jgi:MoaA/NifB/PqqE/SkfB family radical SAM enzyme